MKTTQAIKKLLFVGIVSLAFASCGGGGGGENPSETGNDDTTNNNTPQDKVKIPEQLTETMELTFEQNASKTKLDIVSATRCVDVKTGAECAINYVRTGERTAVLTVTPAGSSPYKIKLTLTSANGGTYELENGSTGSFVLTGLDDNTDSTDSGEGGEETSPDDNNTDNGLAPKSLPIGQDLIIQSANGESVVFRMTSSDSAQFGNETGKVKYELLSPDSALFEYMGKTGTLQYILEFSSSSAGMSKNKLTGTKSNFSIGKYASPVPSPGDDDSDDTPEDTTPGDDVPDDTPEDTTPGDDVSGDTPEDTTPGDDVSGDTPEDTTPGDDVPGDAPEDTTPGDDDSGDTPVEPTPGDDDTPEEPTPEQPVYIAPENLNNRKFTRNSEYYAFVRVSAMEYSNGWERFNGAWYEYERTGLTTGTLSFKNAFYRTGGVYFETQKTRKSSGDIKLTFSKTSSNKLKVKMEGWVREEVTEYDRSELPADISTTTNSIRVYGEYDVTP